MDLVSGDMDVFQKFSQNNRNNHTKPFVNLRSLDNVEDDCTF